MTETFMTVSIIQKKHEKLWNFKQLEQMNWNAITFTFDYLLHFYENLGFETPWSGEVTDGTIGNAFLRLSCVAYRGRCWLARATFWVGFWLTFSFLGCFCFNMDKLNDCIEKILLFNTMQYLQHNEYLQKILKKSKPYLIAFFSTGGSWTWGFVS